MMKSYLDHGSFEMGIEVYKQMRQLGDVEHDGFTLPIVNQLYLMLCCDVRYAKMIHCVGIQMGFTKDVYFCNTLINFYLKCGYTSLAHQLFDEMSHRDVVSWTSMISCYVSEGNISLAFELFSEMRSEVEPNFVTVITLLQTCSTSGNVILGNQFHGYLLKKGLLNDGSVRNSLLQMYTNKGTFKDVEMVFSELGTIDVVTWNILISFYLSVGNIIGVIEKFHDMLREQGITPSLETLTLMASSLSKSGSYAQGQQLHCFAIKISLSDHVFLTCLMDLYSKFGDLEASVRLFTEIPCESNTITVSTLMSGFIEHGEYEKAIGLFKQLQSTRVVPTVDTIKALLDVCGDTGALHMGKEIHGYYLKLLSEGNSVLETSILNMYIRCGSLLYARHCFGVMVEKDVVAWTSIIEGLGTYGLGLEALAHFDQMLKEGIEPNAITFLSILSACSHSGLTNEGCDLLYAMKWDFGVEPELNHYTCIVDLLARSGKLKEALTVILKLVACPDSRIWGALLSASRVYMDRKIGNYAAKCLLELEPDNIGYQIIFSNMQASVEHWAQVEELRNIVTEVNSKKTPGWSCIETNGEIQGFVSGDRSHPDVEVVYELLGLLSRQMKDPALHLLS